MKNQFKSVLGLAVVLLMLSISSCQRVAPNYIGVLMENYGKAGKADFSTVKGRVSTAFSPGTELFQVPLWKQRAAFDQPLALQASDQTGFKAKPSYSYSVIEERAVDVVFQNKQLESGEAFMRSMESNILEMDIYDIMKEESRKYETDTLMAKGGSLRFQNRVIALVKEAFKNKGLKLETFTVQLEFSASVAKKIDNRNEVNTNIALIDRKILEQRKINELALLKAEENKIISSGITPEILQQNALNKWDGKLPATFAGGSLPFIKSIK